LGVAVTNPKQKRQSDAMVLHIINVAMDYPHKKYVNMFEEL
jgi:hypothetical protein